jgi:NitT/TauT family transport system substrate-binding protein
MRSLKEMPMTRRLAVLPMLLALLVTTMAPQSRVSAAANDAPGEMTIAYQPGLSYSNLIVMREEGALEKKFPGTKFNWIVLSSTAAVRDGFIANQIQIGAGSIPPFLTGWDRGVGWKILASLNLMDIWLVAKDKNLHTLKDIKPDMKIGMPSPDSMQSLILRKGALEQLGNAHALDTSIVSIDHPSGMQALSVGQLAAHLTAPPFEYQEVQAGDHVMMKSFDIFGKHSFNSVYVNEKFANDHPMFIAAFYHALLDATQFLKAHPHEASIMLAKDAGGKVPASDFESWIKRKDVIFSTTPRGVLQIAKFMQSIGGLSKVPGSMRDVNLNATLGGAGD